MIKLLSLFSGIGAFEKALTNLNVAYEVVNFCEIDKFASKAYSSIHSTPETKNLGDITKINLDSLPQNIDLLTYGFPCQDISISGKQKGLEVNGEKTRSGLFFDALEIIKLTKPKVAIAENVSNLVSKKFKNSFLTILNLLGDAGYKSYFSVLNAKDYNVPQDRKRVFIVSIRNDIDIPFEFPKPIKLTKVLKDLLDEKVDDKYNLSEKQIKYAKTTTFKQNTYIYRLQDKNGICNTICARFNGNPFFVISEGGV